MANPQSVQALKTYTIKNGSSTASLTVVRRQDGSYRFTDSSGNVRTVFSKAASLNDEPLYGLLEAIDALV